MTILEKIDARLALFPAWLEYYIDTKYLYVEDPLTVLLRFKEQGWMFSFNDSISVELMTFDRWLIFMSREDLAYLKENTFYMLNPKSYLECLKNFSNISFIPLKNNENK